MTATRCPKCGEPDVHPFNELHCYGVTFLRCRARPRRYRWEARTRAWSRWIVAYGLTQRGAMKRLGRLAYRVRVESAKPDLSGLSFAFRFVQPDQEAE